VRSVRPGGAEAPAEEIAACTIDAADAYTDASTALVADIDDDIDVEDDDAAAKSVCDHALARTADGYLLTVALPAGVRADGVECVDDRTVRVRVPGAAPLVVFLEEPVDPAKTAAAYKKKKSVLRVTLVRAEGGTDPGTLRDAFIDAPDHAAFMEDLGKLATKRGYVPPMSSLEDYSDTVKAASR